MKKLFFITILCIAQISCTQSKDNRGYKVSVNEQVPDLSFSLMDGTKITSENLKGKVVVLQFTASWCSVCRKEMPHLESEVWQRYKDQDFILIGIDLKEDVEKVTKFIEQMKVTYPFAIDSDGLLFEKFALPKAGVTRNIVLNKQGKIIFLSRLYELEEFQEMIDVIESELHPR